MSKFIILRGNSGSGKSTVAHEIATTLGRKVAIIAGDYYRQHMLFPKGECGEEVGELMAQNVRHCLSKGYIVFLDSIFYAHDVNKQYLGELLKGMMQPTITSSILMFHLKRLRVGIRHGLLKICQHGAGQTPSRAVG